MLRFLCQLSPYPYYTYIKRIYEHHESAAGPSGVHLLECGAITLYILRLVALQLALSHHLTSHLSWDPVGQYTFQHRPLYGSNVLLCFALLGVFALLTNWLLFLHTASVGKPTSSALSWQALVYDLIVRNVDQARRCTAERRLNQNITKLSPFRRLRTFLAFLKDKMFLSDLDLGKLARSELSILAFLSVTHRKKILQLHLLLSAGSRLFQLFYVLPSILVLTIQITRHVWAAYPGTIPLSGWLLLLTDLLLIVTASWLLYRNVLLFLYLDLIASLAFRWHLQAGHRTLAYLSLQYRSTFTSSLTSWHRLLLRSLLTEHARIGTLADAFNRQIISLATFSALACNCPTNIYLIYRVIYMKILVSEFGLILLMTALQLLCLAVAFTPLAQANSALYRTGKYLPGVQLYVLRGGNCRCLKIKYEILQSTLTESRVKSGATIGPLCLITFESLYKVVSLYAVYMLVLFDLLPK